MESRQCCSNMDQDSVTTSPISHLKCFEKHWVIQCDAVVKIKFQFSYTVFFFFAFFFFTQMQQSGSRHKCYKPVAKKVNRYLQDKFIVGFSVLSEIVNHEKTSSALSFNCQRMLIFKTTQRSSDDNLLLCAKRILFYFQ